MAMTESKQEQKLNNSQLDYVLVLYDYTKVVTTYERP